MRFQSDEFSGGESVYCINQTQLRKAKELVYENPNSKLKLTQTLERLQSDLSRNELAALSFVLIDTLQHSPSR